MSYLKQHFRTTISWKDDCNVNKAQRFPAYYKFRTLYVIEEQKCCVIDYLKDTAFPSSNQQQDVTLLTTVWRKNLLKNNIRGRHRGFQHQNSASHTCVWKKGSSFWTSYARNVGLVANKPTNKLSGKRTLCRCWWKSSWFLGSKFGKPSITCVLLYTVLPTSPWTGIAPSV